MTQDNPISKEGLDIRDVRDYVRDITEPYERRISAMTDLFHQLQLSFKEQDTFLRTKLTDIEARYVNGTSHTLQEVKKQNEELAKSMEVYRRETNEAISKMDKTMAVATEHQDGIELEQNKKWIEYAEIKHEMREVIKNLVIRGIIGIVTLVVTAGIAMFFKFQQIQFEMEEITRRPIVIQSQGQKHHVTPFGEK